MKLLTFLGVGQYSETIYTWNGQEHLAKYAPIATANMVNATSMTIFLTEDAHQRIYPDFKKSLPSNIQEITPIPIELGKNETELWKIFDIISRSVTPEEKIAFDITHGLRSSPLLGLLAAAFLRASQEVDIQHVFYGAYDVRDQSSTPAKTPIFDLTPMLALLDWTSATNRFTKTGDARDLANLMERAANGNEDVLAAATSVKDVSMAAFLCQPMPLAKKSEALITSLTKAQERLQIQVPPFELLRTRITNDFKQFTHDEHDFKGLLQAQLNLIRWYDKNNQLMQALTLTREWLISAVMYKLELPFTQDHNIREEVARGISGLSLLKSKGKIWDENLGEKRKFTPSDLNSHGKDILNVWPDTLWKKMVGAWFRTNIRNQLNHAGYQAKPEEINTIIISVNETIPILISLSSDFGINTP